MRLGESFEGVLAAARAGEEWAWRAIYQDLAPAVLGYLRASGEAEPEDLMGEVFVQLVRDLATFDGGEQQFRAWVFTVAHHRLLDERRRRRRRPVQPAEAVGEQEIGGDAEEDALARLGETQVRSALSRLSRDQRNVLLLRLLGDLTVHQVARALGKTPGAVKALQRRGLAALKREISRLGVTL
jgi:RNA polymerase sigma factor (sigma-70 family)